MTKQPIHPDHDLLWVIAQKIRPAIEELEHVLTAVKTAGRLPPCCSGPLCSLPLRDRECPFDDRLCPWPHRSP